MVGKADIPRDKCNTKNWCTEGSQDVTVSDDLFKLSGNTEQTDLNQDRQQGPVVTSDTQVTSDMTQPVSTDQEVQDQCQPVIERVLCARRYRDKRWYKVKWVDFYQTELVTKDIVPRNVPPITAMFLTT